MIVELKSEALKERHWKTLMRKLHVNWVLSDLNLGQVWDVDLQKNEMIVKDVILVAQGEMALEEFLKQVRPSRILRAWLLSVVLLKIEKTLCKTISHHNQNYSLTVTRYETLTITWIVLQKSFKTSLVFHLKL